MKKIGMRNIKTGIAVFLASLAGYIGMIQAPIYTVSVCIFSIKSTVKDSLDDAISRVLGSILGGFIGYLFALVANSNIILTSIGVIFVIHLCKIFKIAESAGIASVTFAAIVLGVNENNPFAYSVSRTFDTLVGVLIALVVNFWVSRRNYLKYLCSEFNKTHSECKVLVNTMIQRGDYCRCCELNEKFDSLKYYYSQLVDEIVYSNETGDLINIKNCFEAWDQLLYHLYGLNLLRTDIKSSEHNNHEVVYEYHLNKVQSLLNSIYEFDIDMDILLNKKVA